MNRDGKEVVGVGRVYLTYHGDGNVGIGTPPQVASAPLGEPVEHLRVSMTDGVGITPKDMNREDIIRMAQEAGFKVDWQHADVAEIKAKRYEYFAALVANAEREKLAAWMMRQGYATGHGDTVEDLLKELEWQIEERISNEREACAKVCDGMDHNGVMIAADCAAAIRARGNT